MKLKEQEQNALDKNVVAKRWAQRVQAINKGAAAAAAVASGVAIIVFPPAVLAMPVLVPLVVLASEIFNYKNKKKIKGKLHWHNPMLTWTITYRTAREMEARDCRDVIRDMRNVSKALSKFRVEVGVFSNYWLALDTTLDELPRRINDLRATKGNRIRLRAILDIWKELKEEYSKYLTSVSPIFQYNCHICLTPHRSSDSCRSYMHCLRRRGKRLSKRRRLLRPRNDHLIKFLKKYPAPSKKTPKKEKTQRR